MYIDQQQQRERRDHWFALTRNHIYNLVNPDGSAKMLQFDPPFREPIWILPALYRGSDEFVQLANRMVERNFDPTKINPNSIREKTGKEFGIFQSNSFAVCLHHFHDLLSPGAQDVMVWHTEQVFKTYKGAAQPDYKFHGANDNMPMLASKGLILGGEALGNQAAIAHGVWNLNQFRRLLSRSAWASEFNSSTYTAGTLNAVAHIATYAADAAVRELALEIEHRMWAEVLLHYHPGTMHQAGPHSRAYAIDEVGHNHGLQGMLWMAFGPQLTGRDPVRTYFEPDGIEVRHFSGNPWQTIAEFCESLDTDLHVPETLAPLVTQRQYPALLRGRSECMGRFAGQAAVYHTETWMEESFSLGTVNGPLAGGEQTTSLYATYRRKPELETFHDAATVFCKYLTREAELGAMETSLDGAYQGEAHVHSQGWFYALQKQNTALLLCTPNLVNTPLTTDTLKLSLVFPAHFGQITRTIMGTVAREGAGGESDAVVPVSIEAGEVFMHVQPLLPTALPRGAALRFRRQNHYEILEIINYEDESREWTRGQLALVPNGLVLTVADKSKWDSLAEFHAAHSEALITDYCFGSQRFVHFQRPDAEFEVVYTTDPFGIQTESVDGRPVPRPVFESNQLDVEQLPFVSGPVSPNKPFFPWGDSLDAWPYDDMPWMIGSRGLPDEVNYSRPAYDLKKSA